MSEIVTSNLDTSDIIEWDTLALHRTARLLKTEVDLNPIPRQREIADRNLGRVAFEMWARRHHDTPEEAILGSKITVENY